LIISTIKKKSGTGGSSNNMLRRTLIIKKSSVSVKEKIFPRILAIAAGKCIKV
jgi:hypothetical protein